MKNNEYKYRDIYDIYKYRNIVESLDLRVDLIQKKRT